MNAEPPPNFWRGEKVRLRAVEEHDLEAAAIQEPDTDLERFEDFIHFPVSKQQNRENWEHLGRKRDDDTFFWVIENAEGERVGNIGTFDCDRRVGAFKYGVVILRPFWRRGYAREAIGIALRYYFHELRYQKVTAIVYSFNKRSQRLHERLGFTLEGRLRRMVYTNGTLYDELYFGLTREEFDERNPTAEV